jgi:hypothetical protein
MSARSRFVSCAVLTLVSFCGGSATTRDPVEGIPISRQRTISRAALGFRWPLSVGVGTLACDDAGTVLFRSQGITYLLHGERAGTHDVQALRMPEPAAPPSNPLKRLKQADREDAFQQVTRCESHAADKAGCRRAAVQRLGLSDAEWEQIDVEGHERRWPPLSRAAMSLDPLIAAGRALCQSAAER